PPRVWSAASCIFLAARRSCNLPYRPRKSLRMKPLLRCLPMDLSIVIPIKDERDNLSPLHDRLRQALDPLNKSYEIIFVDDGSVDGSYFMLEALAQKDHSVKVVRLRRNFGQSAAM